MGLNLLKQLVAISLFGHTKILHMPVPVGSAALVAAVVLTR